MLHATLRHSSNHRIPDWLIRALSQGMTPRALDAYRQNGWPIKSIAQIMNLEIEGVRDALERWEIP
ncbi:MAG: hypothetical protein RLZZ627_12 [Pseudomonadota bacterium]|jgi:hypothetical protein